MALGVGKREEVALVTTTVETGTVRQLVSVSGVAEAEQTAELAFPTSGIVATVLVNKGDVVSAGDTIMTLESGALAADRTDAYASLARAVANRDELLAGPATESRAATAETISFKQTSLETIRATQADLVANAKRTLLSSGLEAISNEPNEQAVAPTISGTYSCDQEGSYIIEVFSSSANSGYSYRLSGLETDTTAVSTNQATLLGSCGLRAIFDPSSQYRDSSWTITIPNQKSPLYVTNRNTYALTQTQSASAITIAEQDLVLTQANANSTNAPARSEAVARANADITSANARIARIDSQISDRILTAPFAGTITEIDILPGETVTTLPVVTLLAEADFEVTARIPEIDIGKLAEGQTVEMVFDAKSDVTMIGTVDFISLKSTEIDGVAYYEALIILDETPTWIRSGLNADIDIVISEVSDMLRVPKRFISEVDGTYSILVQSGINAATTTIDVLLEGNDGYVAITGVTSGTTVVAP
jgi:HlyD family secretion protein